MTRELEDAVSAALGSREPRTATEIAAELDAHPMTVRRCCDELQRAGRLRQVTGGGYVRADHGPAEPRASD
jgi:predicted ArsR family transcriptional regulator